MKSIMIIWFQDTLFHQSCPDVIVIYHFQFHKMLGIIKPFRVPIKYNQKNLQLYARF